MLREDPAPEDCDVVIVGLGPTGAVLANLLGQYGLTVIGLEREEDLYYAPRAVHFDDEIMRVFQAIGLSDAISVSSEPFAEMEFRLKRNGRAAGRLKFGSQDGRYGFAGAWWFHQPTLERHFQQGMRRFANVRVHYGVEALQIEQSPDRVTVTASDRTGATRAFRGRYLVGCDGGRSFVRRAASLPLESADFDEAWVVVDTKTRSGGKEPSLPRNHHQLCDPRQPVTYVPLAGPYYEWQFMVVDGKSEKEVTDPARVRRQLREFVDLSKIEIIRIAYYRFHGLWAQRWRNGRVILAGDAAHQMPPFLGQGMCSGIRDAVALAWRLDLILRGRADERLFDDYETERLAHVRHIINGAMFLGHIIQTRNRFVAVLRNYLLFLPANWVPLFNRLLTETAIRKRPLESGFIGATRAKLAGALVIQPRMRDAYGRVFLLDEALGPDFAVLARAGALAGRSTAIDDLNETAPTRLVEFGADALRDHDGRLGPWFEKNDVDFVIVRPDRYVYDGGRAQDFDAVARNFRARFAVAAPSIERAAA